MDTYKNYQIKWSREDEEYLSQKYSIIKDLDKFQCADFEINESENIKIMPKNLNWNPISIQKNNINNNDENNKDNNKENNNNDNNDIKSENYKFK